MKDYDMKLWYFEDKINNDPSELQRLLSLHDRIVITDDDGNTLFYVLDVEDDGSYTEKQS